MAKAVKKLVKASTEPLDFLKPDIPDMKEPETMPDIDEEEAARMEQRRLQRRRRTGRLSTVLSGESTLG